MIKESFQATGISLLLQALDAVQKGSRKLLVRTVDTKVVVLSISKFHQISPDELRMAFGTKSNFFYLPHL